MSWQLLTSHYKRRSCKKKVVAVIVDIVIRKYISPYIEQKQSCRIVSGSTVTAVNVDNLAGLNALGISLARIDFAPNGLNPPHTHPRGSEILVVLEGTLYVGFVTSNADNNRLITKVLNKGDVFVFPIGLIHFQLNVGYGKAVAIAGLSSQNPGVITIADAVFGSKPPINPDVLAKAFQVDNKLVDYLQKQFWYDKN